VKSAAPPHTGSDARSLRQAFHSLIRRFGLLDSDRTPCDQPLAVSHAHALMELLRNPGVRQLDLARTLGLSKSAVSRMVDHLQRRGWIERQADDNDGRAWRLRLSARGRRLARRIDQASIARFSAILDRIPAAMRGQVVSTLDLLHGAIPTETEEERVMPWSHGLEASP
jgi:DNA-binding MarR family transcriptional regulator